MPFAVGDDDQSIYRWRGARVENLNQFRRDYPQAVLYKLEQNYRSTGTILKAANALIANNAGRLGKTLWTSGEDGERVKLYAAFNERDEADFVVNRIREWVERGGARREVAVLYRSNAQSRVFEEAFLNARMPYRVYGGLRFFERAEIKDALAYLRLVASRADDTSFERVVNLPARGIGAKTLDPVREIRARQRHLAVDGRRDRACRRGLAQRARAGAARASCATIDKLAGEIRGLELHEQVDHVIQTSGLIEHLQEGEGRARRRPRRELAGTRERGARASRPRRRDRHAAARVLSRARRARIGRGSGGSLRRLRADDDPAFGQGSGVPRGVSRRHGGRAVSAPALGGRSRAALEEERRLCYVGATRAMRQLYITYAEQRRLYGVDQYGQPSRFINELPPELIEEIRPAPAGVAAAVRQATATLEEIAGVRRCGWEAGCGTPNSATAWCSISRATGRRPASR